MRMRIEIIDSNAGEEAEVIVVNGGREETPIVMNDEKAEIEVEVAAPQAVVIREKPLT